MKQEGLQPCRRTYTKAVRTCWFNKMTELAESLTEEMKAAGFEADERFYSVQIRAARDVGPPAMYPSLLRMHPSILLDIFS